MSLVETIRTDMTTAWRAGDLARRDTLRLVIAAIENSRIQAGHDLSDAEAIAVLQREAKQRRDSIEQYRSGHREDLAAAEAVELDVIAAYLPVELTDEELRAEAAAVIAEVGASAPDDVGRVMGPLMQRIAGRADGRRANAIARELLTSA